jgi:hypothetical protein
MVETVSDAERGFLRALIVYSIKRMDRQAWTVPLKLKLKYKVKLNLAEAEWRHVDAYFLHQTILYMILQSLSVQVYSSRPGHQTYASILKQGLTTPHHDNPLPADPVDPPHDAQRP